MRQGANWIGTPGHGMPPDIRSPYQYPPVRRYVQSPGTGYDAATVITTAPDAPLNVVFEIHCEWVYVADTGGAGQILIYPGRGGDAPQSVKNGSVVWIGDGSCAVAYAGAAPTTPVLLIGCAVGTALVLSAQSDRDASPAAAPAVTTTALITMMGYNGDNFDSVAVPGTGARTVQIDLATDTPPGRNAPASVFILSSDPSPGPSHVNAPEGIIMLPGGTYVWPGGPAYITEVADIAGVDAFATVAYVS